ncbi:MAG: radical SAM family heme chaperone HemW [Micavibrio sp.]
MFGIYVHWPFCAAKCPYCDFNSHVRESIDHAAWRDAYIREIQHYASLTPDRQVTSVFFGGGTPSLMEPETVKVVIDQIKKSWPHDPAMEITLEANPTSVEAAKFKGFREAGVNRVSIGVQSLRDEDLSFLGRKHNRSEALKAIDLAKENFERFSFDLMYARPNQKISDWVQELDEAVKLSVGHLSLYQLTIEEGTPFHTQYARGDFMMPSEDLGGEFYEITQSVLEAAGLPAYEISNHAKRGQESQHNLTYWRYTDYVGIGPGAHGRLTLDGQKIATRGHRAPEIWMERVMKSGHGGHEHETVTPEQRWMEALMMGLRLREGVPYVRLEAEAGKAVDQILDPRKLKVLADEGLLILENDRLRPTSEGRQRLNGVLAYLL